MFGKKSWKKKRLQEVSGDLNPKTVADLYAQLKDYPDFTHFEYKGSRFHCWISFFRSLVDVDYVHRDILSYLSEQSVHSLSDIQNRLPIEKLIRTKDVSEIQSKLLRNYVIIQEKEHDPDCLIVPMIPIVRRQVVQPEIETSIIGPKEGFVEALDVNLSLVRQRIPIPQCSVEEVTVGKISNTRVSLIYIEGIANEENVNTVRQRIRDLEVSSLIDVTMLADLISDNCHSPFPQFIDTERPDRAAGAVYEGKIAVLVDGSPSALILPSTIVEFFSAFDDYFLAWHIGSGYRLIRLFFVVLSSVAPSLYVAVLTYHYQLIPKELLGSLILSRSIVPFDPIMEALILEVMIELLREAGARLPTKVGQTIGIVGGIVIGTASVQAGLTSNVLLIIVAMSALGSFITPNYRMATTIRFLRFPFLISAGVLGLPGLALCITFFICHLLKLTSLGRPYIEPIYPLRVTDLKDAFIRLPYSAQITRPMFLRPGDATRSNPRRIRMKRGPRQPDIDE
ncbi:spore germination protein [Sporolactobacillus sp. THM7-7]|nr:spore germination protein [Sporolactobacillus sp. THM7-7]